MIQRLIDASLNHRLVVVALWTLLVAAGIHSALHLPIDALPDITNIQVQVLTDSPGLAPEEVEQFVTFPVETAMSGLPRVEEIRSLSKFGLSVVTVVFDEGTDIYWARQQVSERLAQAREAIPAGYGEPALAPITTGLGEVYHFEVDGQPRCAPKQPDTEDCWSLMELRSILDWLIIPQLRSVPGVVEVNAFGGEVKTFQATLDAERLMARGLGVSDVVQAIRSNNLNAGGGFVAFGGEQYVIRGEGLIRTLEDLERVVVATQETTPVYLRDVADVELAPLLRQGAATRDGDREAVAGIVLMLLGENSRAVAQRVDERVGEISSTLPDGVVIDTYYDRSDLVNRTLGTVAGNLLKGGLLVVVILLLLIGSLRAGLLVAAVIPLSMLVTFSAMRWLGIPGNLMSLGAIDFGLIVDAAVVVVDSILRAFRKRAGETGVSDLEKVRTAVHQVARPVVFGVSIIILVYIPLLSLRGVEGKMFRPMALTVGFALFASLLCALTLIPAVASWLLPRVRSREPLLYRVCRRLYLPLLDRALAHRRLTVGAAVLLLAVGLAIAPFLGAEFIPTLDEGAIAMHIQRLPSISLEQSNQVSLMAEKTILDEFSNEVSTVVSRTGRPEVALDPMGVEIGDTFVMLHPEERWRFASKEALVEAIQDELQAQVPGAKFAFTQPIELRFAELMTGVRSDVAVHLYGSDFDLLRQKAEEIEAALRSVPGAADVAAEQIQGLPRLRVTVDREAIARYGLSVQEVFQVLEALGGIRVGTVLEGAMRFPVQVRYPERLRDDPQRLKELRIAAAPAEPGGPPRMIPLDQLATIRVAEGPAQINRHQVSRRIGIEANVRGRDLASFVAEAQRTVAEQVELPAGWRLSWGGQYENLQEASQRLLLIVPAVLLLIFILLYSAFGSGRLTVLVFLNVPLALSGGLLALGLRGYPFSISAAVGFIAVFGIAVLNGLVLMEHIRNQRQTGLGPRQAAREGARLRLRAVLMTASTDIIGFLPMAVATSAGAEVQRPLATVVVGGLITATLLTLLVLPALYARTSDTRPSDTVGTVSP
ncbi:MAG: CusA/CzcA family heavy metal efflux RND transporter [Acidobacteriota bacterium]|nr:CusA/CzcA family heavy metal efflux RND transporter [Acidobacteriota bacterium]